MHVIGESGGEATVRACHQMCVIKCAMQPGATLTYPSRPAFTAVGTLPRERQLSVVEPLRNAEEPSLATSNSNFGALKLKYSIGAVMASASSSAYRCLVWDGKERQLLEALLGPEMPTVLDQRKAWAQLLNPYGREVSKDFPFPRHTLAFATTVYDIKVFPHEAEKDTKLQARFANDGWPVAYQVIKEVEPNLDALIDAAHGRRSFESVPLPPARTVTPWSEAERVVAAPTTKKGDIRSFFASKK